MNDLTVKGLVITTPIATILTALQSELQSKGINKLANIVIGNSNAQVTCPYHKDGQERKPSCGVLLYGDEKTVQGQVHCFTCGTTVPFVKFISDCFNVADNGEFGEQWLLRNFISSEYRKLGFDFDEKRVKVQPSYVSEEELDRYRYYHPYMFQRKLTEDVIQLFDVGYDAKTECLTFPVNDAQGNCLFVARRSVKSKFFNYPEDVEKPVYGIDKLPTDCKSVIVVESFINCLTLWAWGYYSVALLGTGSEQQYASLKSSDIREFVLALDGDNAGRKGAQRFINALSDCKFIKYIKMPNGKDVNDLSKEEFLALPLVEI